MNRMLAGASATDLPSGCTRELCPMSCEPAIFRRMRRSILLVIGLFVAAAVLIPSVALAGNSSATPATPGGGVAGTSGTAGVSGGALPFTGLNLVYVLAAGLALIGLGIALRRRSGRSAS